MSFSHSRKSSRNPCPPSRSAGIALVSVLWLLMLLSGLAATVAYIARVEALLTRRAFDLARVQAVADAAIVNTISELSAEQANRRPEIGVPRSWEFDSIPVTVVVTREAGRIDMNTANDRLLRAFLQAHGLTAGVVSGLVDQLRGWQGGGNRPLETLEELRLVPGWREQDVGCWFDSLTVYSGQPDVDLLDTMPGALAAVDWLRAHDPDYSRAPLATSGVSPLGARSVLGEVVRIRASATTGAVSTTSEWIGRVTGDRSKPMLTMSWNQRADRENDGSCGRTSKRL